MLVVLAFFLGIMTWSASEYVLHRWAFHGPRGRTVVNSEHIDHHARQSYFAPTWKKLVLASSTLLLLGVPAALVLGGPGLAWAAGLVTFYGVYEIVHRRCHTHAPRGFYGRYVRKHHLYHHFHAPTKNHGVTSPVWDWVFGTYEKPGVIKVPEKQVMVWLCDPATGDVADPWVSDYRIAWRRGSQAERRAA